jgi:hypothetical protein
MARAAIGALIALAAVHPAFGLTPDSPEVRAAVARGIKFLESGKANDDRLGARALVGLAMIKADEPLDHPKILVAVKDVQAAVEFPKPEQLDSGDDSIYSMGLAAIFLIELDPRKYENEIQKLLDYLWYRQKKHGAWGYETRSTGDTSMTQYAVLCAWEASQVGFNVPNDSMERVATWLLKTQDPSGGFGYQGRIASSYNSLQQQTVSHSMTAAGLGSVYICTDLLGLVTPPEEPEEDVPSALTRVESAVSENPALPRAKTTIDPRLFREAVGRGMGWMQKNYQAAPAGYTHYYMYALERCMSFRELAQGKLRRKPGEDGPVWYNDGAKHLLDTQEKNGSWVSGCKSTADTAFAILFLLRSTRKTIEKVRNFGDGVLLGGRGLPKDTDRAYLKDGEVVVRPLMGPAEQLMKILEEQDQPDWEQLAEVVAEAPSQDAVSAVEKHIERFRGLIAAESPAARLAAVRALARSRSLENVPVLIYALTDPDPVVLREARDALRRISRKPLGFGLPDAPSDADRVEAITKWKAWYRAFRPDVEFEDY